MKHSKSLLFIFLISLMLCGCGNTKSGISVKEYATSTIDVSTVSNQLLNVIKTGNTENCSVVTNEFELDDIDIVGDATVNNTYTSDNAMYIQIESGDKQYMFRFQLNENNIVTSYIKYSLGE